MDLSKKSLFNYISSNFNHNININIVKKYIEGFAAQFRVDLNFLF